MNKLFTQYKRHLSNILILAKDNDLSFAMTRQTINAKANSKQLYRKQKRYGCYFDWDTSEMDELGLTVNLCSHKDGEVLIIHVFVSKLDLPKQRQHYWK